MHPDDAGGREHTKRDQQVQDKGVHPQDLPPVRSDPDKGWSLIEGAISFANLFGSEITLTASFGNFLFNCRSKQKPPARFAAERGL
jgi:hypothetical protein